MALFVIHPPIVTEGKREQIDEDFLPPLGRGQSTPKTAAFVGGIRAVEDPVHVEEKDFHCVG